MKTQAFIPARAAWAETLFARLPVEAQASVSNSKRLATLLATETTRSLNDHVGFWQSFLMYRWSSPRARARLLERISGREAGADVDGCLGVRRKQVGVAPHGRRAGLDPVRW